MELLLEQAMRRAERAMAGHIRSGDLGTDAYMECIALVDDLASMPGAEEWAPGIAQIRFAAARIYQRPCDEVEKALQARLATLGRDQMRRFNAAAAAYVMYPQLSSYFETEAAAVHRLPVSELRTNLLASIERVRAIVQRTSDPEVSNA